MLLPIVFEVLVKALQPVLVVPVYPLSAKLKADGLFVSVASKPLLAPPAPVI